MFSSLSRKRIIALVILTSLLLITLDRRHNPVIDRVRSGFQAVLQPFDTAAEAISKPIARAWYGVTNYDSLERENEALRDQLDAQKGAEVVAKSVIYQSQELLQLYQLAQNYKHQFGRVVGAAPSNFQNTVEINIGANRGVKVGMQVISNAGLIGKITSVYAESSEVLLITDPRYSVAAQVLAVVGSGPASSSTTIESTTPSGLPVDASTTSTTTASTTTASPGAT
ncbi:MAG: rod shape-determining protein MreC, partial [Ilumatobacteraceae bacterium]